MATLPELRVAVRMPSSLASLESFHTMGSPERKNQRVIGLVEKLSVLVFSWLEMDPTARVGSCYEDDDAE